MLQSDASKRDRGKNFHESEVNVLLSLVQQYKDVVLKKRNNKVTIAEKKYVWKLIEQEFNNTPGMVYFRDAKTLQNKYGNMKKIVKKKWNTDQQGIPGTEEHSSEPSEIISIENKLKELLTEADDIDMSDEFDFEAEVLYSPDEDSEDHKPSSDQSPEVISPIQVDFTRLPVAIEEEITDFPDHCYSVFTRPNCKPGPVDKSEITDSSKQSSPSSGTSCGMFSVSPTSEKKINACSTIDGKVAEICNSCGAHMPDSGAKVGAVKITPTAFQTKYKSQFSHFPLRMELKRKSPHLGKAFHRTKVEHLSKKQDVMNLKKRVLRDTQILMQEEEYKLKLKCIEEKHKLELKCIREKHDLEMKLLQWQIQNEELSVRRNTYELAMKNA